MYCIFAICVIDVLRIWIKSPECEMWISWKIEIKIETKYRYAKNNEAAKSKESDSHQQRKGIGVHRMDGRSHSIDVSRELVQWLFSYISEQFHSICAGWLRQLKITFVRIRLRRSHLGIRLWIWLYLQWDR